MTLLALGRGDEALDAANKEPYPVVRLWALAIVHHGLGHAQESDAALHGMVTHETIAMSYDIAEVHAARREVDRAFEWLERAYEERDSGVAEVRVGRHLRSLHGDPRWGAFLRKVGFEE